MYDLLFIDFLFFQHADIIMRERLKHEKAVKFQQDDWSETHQSLTLQMRVTCL